VALRMAKVPSKDKITIRIKVMTSTTPRSRRLVLHLRAAARVLMAQRQGLRRPAWVERIVLME
jgi:hypothetical protein